MVCGLPAALSTTETVAVRLPVVDGVKVRLIVWLAFGARVTGLLPAVNAKLLLFVPLRVILLMTSDALPVLVSVTLCGALVVFTRWPPKSRLAGLMLTAGVIGSAPAPVSVTVCGLPGASS